MRALIAGLALALMCASAIAKPVAVAAVGKTRVTLYSEPCKLKAVSNLEQRAVWNDDDKKKQYEGCWQPTQFGFVVSYFDDGSIALIPFEVFVAPTEI